MMSYSLVTLLLVTALCQASAQSTTTVTVGAGGTLAFSPTTVTAQPGDTIVFSFQANNHSATQSTFDSPCSELPGGFDSGFLPPTAGATSNFPSFTYTVNSTDPVWVYCAQTTPINHCQRGMVFAINPTSSDTFATFQQAAQSGSAPSTTSSSSASSASVASSSSAAAASSSASSIALLPATATLSVNGTAVTTTYSSYPGSPAPTVDATPQVLPVTVGFNATLTYSPSTVSANIGDIVTFTFPGGNHTATQTSFDAPCVAALNSDGSAVFSSGFEFVASGTSAVSVNYTVSTENPIWFACLQTKPVDHCGAGMVFAINPPANGSQQDFTAFKSLAMTLNGSATTASPSTGASGSSTPSPSPSTGTSGAATLQTSMTAIGVIAVVFTFLA